VYAPDQATHEYFVTKLDEQEKHLLADREAISQRLLRVYDQAVR
jgi:hypothetical protein